MFGEKGVVAAGEHIDNGIADGNDVQRGGGSGHAKSFMKGKNPAVSIDPCVPAQRPRSTIRLTIGPAEGIAAPWF
jgi:hypothetical protein